MRNSLLTLFIGLLLSISFSTANSEDAVATPDAASKIETVSTPVEKEQASTVTITTEQTDSSSADSDKKNPEKTNEEISSQDKKSTETTKQKKANQTVLKLAKVDVSGVPDDLKKNIELHMPVTVPECDADRGDVKLFFNTVKKNLRKATRALGYYDAEFTSGGSIVAGCWNLRLKVTAGKPVKVVAQNFDVIGPGRGEKVFKKILSELPYKVGDVLNHQNYTNFKTQLSEAAQALGYFDGEFEKRVIRIDPLSYQAKIDLVLNTGKRYRYGKVTIDQKILSEQAVKKYIIIKEGEFYKAEDLIKQQQVLQSSGYYKTIKIDANHEEVSDLRVPVSIELASKKRNAYKFKVGYGTDTGARATVEMNRRYLGASGKQLKIKAVYSEELPELSIQLLNPRDNPEDNSLIHKIDLKVDSNNDITSHTLSVGSTLVRKFDNGWKRSASITAISDRTEVDGDNETNSDLLMFGVGLEKAKADSLIYPTKGWRLKLSLNLASEIVLSDQNVLQFKAQAKNILKLGDGKLLSRVNFGSTYVNDFDRLPKSLRFFAGGANSVRGYSYESLGEVNDSGSVKGGKQLLDLSLEYQHPILNGWSAAIFADAGNAFNDFNDVNLKVGVGFGARWSSPVGPVRIDLGFPSDDLSSPTLHLSIGSDL